MKPIYPVLFTIFFFCFGLNVSNAQKTYGKIYDPKANAKEELDKAIIRAAKENKNVLIQVGGNWCKWCIAFHKFINNDKQIDSLIKADFVFILINYSTDNKNTEMLKRLENPQRFGFPVLVVLDKNGKRVHTQDSGFLEKNDNYDRDKILTFLKCWTPSAINPDK